MRRAADDDRPYLVDRVSASAFAASALLLVLTLIDGALTLVLLDHGYEEGNPVMRFFLGLGPAPFFAAKYALTAAFLPVALVLNRYRVFGVRVRVGQLVPVVAALYLVLIAYQVVLLRSSQAGGQDGSDSGSPTEWRMIWPSLR